MQAVVIKMLVFIFYDNKVAVIITGRDWLIATCKFFSGSKKFSKEVSHKLILIASENFAVNFLGRKDFSFLWYNYPHIKLR